MRVRIPAIAAAVVLVYLAVEHWQELPALPDPTAMILSMRNQVPTYRFTLATDPEPAVSGEPIRLRVQVVDTDGKPADGLTVEADVSLTGLNGSKHVAFRRKGNGAYEGKLEVDTTGTWNVDLTATKNGKSSRQRLDIDVGPRIETNSSDDDDDN
jgi:nitrogen fixation protein FixH